MRRFLAILLALALTVPASASSGPKGYIALTFDDGPSGPITEQLLAGLEKRGVKATFFLCCYRMEQYPKTLTAIAEGGHEIGLHSCCHQYMNQMTAEEIAADMEACQSMLREYTGLSATLFRPPGGLYNDALLEEAEKAGLSILLWSVDPEDWNPKRQGQVASYLETHAGDGDIVLLHDLYPTSVRAALSVVDRLQAQGYAFCTVSELAKIYGAELKPGQVYWKFG